MDVDAILQRLMPSDKAPGDLNRSSDIDDSPPAAKRDKKIVGSFCSFEDTTGDVSEFLILNPDPIGTVVREDWNKCENAVTTENGVCDDIATAKKAIPLRPPTAQNRKLPGNRRQPQSASFGALTGDIGDVSSLYSAAADSKLLSGLTERLLATLEASITGYVDLDVIMHDIGPAESWRLLHVVGVLEGLGVIEIPLENVVKWRGEESSLIYDERQRMNDLQTDVDELLECEFLLDTHIRWLKQSFLNACEDKENDRLAYTSHDDVLGLYPDRFNIVVRVPTSASIDANVVRNSGSGVGQNSEHFIHELIVRCKSAVPKAYVLSVDGYGAYSVDD